MAKDSPRITAGELQHLVESWGQKPKIRHNWNFNWDWLLWSDET